MFWPVVEWNDEMSWCFSTKFYFSKHFRQITNIQRVGKIKLCRKVTSKHFKIFFFFYFIVLILLFSLVHLFILMSPYGIFFSIFISKYPSIFRLRLILFFLIIQDRSKIESTIEWVIKYNTRLQTESEDTHPGI